MINVMVTNAWDNLLVWKIGYYLGENKIARNIEYFAVPWYAYPLVRFDAWLKESDCRRCYMDRLKAMGVVI